MNTQCESSEKYDLFGAIAKYFIDSRERMEEFFKRTICTESTSHRLSLFYLFASMQMQLKMRHQLRELRLFLRQ